MLKKFRVIISILFFVLITWYFLDFAALLPDSRFNWLTCIQFVPAIFATSVVVVAILLLLTLIFGRIYCSSVCPMGIFQDIVSYFSKKVTKKKRYKFGKAKNVLRRSILALAIIVLVCSSAMFIGFIDPYSAYGRIVVNIFKPVYLMGNNILEAIFTHFGHYTFYRKEIYISSLFTFIVCWITILSIGYLAWKHGRTYCNTICPVGTLLGFVSRISFFKVRIDTTLCNSCGNCERKCKASCINSKAQEVDTSRCVTCFNCLQGCNKKAIHYSFRIKPTGLTGERKTIQDSNIDKKKRQFLTTAIATTVTAPAVLAQGKLDELTGSKQYTRQIAISPPGSISHKHLLKHCTACHLCVSKCPSNVLKPAFLEYGIGGIMQPLMSFDKGYCNYACTICSDVCPNEAIKKLTVEEKHLTQMGKVHFSPDICIVTTEETNCGACAEHCPTQAVTMIPYKNGLTIPHIDPEICIGCGGCEFICPVHPHRAIFIEGNKIQLQAKPFEIEERVDINLDEFGF